MENAIRTHTLADADSVNLFTGFLIGGMVGLGAMLLLAPQSGRKTRDQIRQKSTELQNRTVATFDDLVALAHFDNRKILSGTHRKAETS